MDLRQHLSRADEKDLSQKAKKIVTRVAGEVEVSVMTDAMATVAATLEEAVDLGILEEDIASDIYDVWRQKMARARGELIECGCGNMLLRNDVEYADSDGIRHSPKWCDTIPSNEDVVDMNGLEDPDHPQDD